MKTKLIFTLFIAALAFTGCDDSNSNNDGIGNNDGQGNNNGDAGNDGDGGEAGNNEGAGNEGGQGNNNGDAGNDGDGGEAGNNEGAGNEGGQGNNNGDAGNDGDGAGGNPVVEPPTFCDAAGEGTTCSLNGRLGLCDAEGQCLKCDEVDSNCQNGFVCSVNGYCEPPVFEPPNPCEDRAATSICALENGNLGACPGQNAVCAVCSDADNPCADDYICNGQNYCVIEVIENPCNGQPATTLCAIDGNNLGACDGTNPACQNCSDNNACANGFSCNDQSYCVIAAPNVCAEQNPGTACPLEDGNLGVCPGQNAGCANCNEDNPCTAPFACNDNGYCEVMIPDPCDALEPRNICPISDGNLGVCPADNSDCAACNEDTNPCPANYECTENNYCIFDEPNPCDEIDPGQRCLLSEDNYGVCPADNSDCALCTQGEANPCPESYICNANNYCIAENVDEPNPCDEIEPGDRCLLTADDYGVCPADNSDCAVCTVNNENPCPEGYDCNPQSGYCREELVEDPDPCDDGGNEPAERCLLTNNDYGVCPADNSDCAVCDDDTNPCPENYDCNDVGYCVEEEIDPNAACNGLEEGDLCNLTANAQGICSDTGTCERCAEDNECGAGRYCTYRGYCNPTPDLQDNTCESYCYHFVIKTGNESLCRNNPIPGSRGLFNPDQTLIDRGVNKAEQCMEICGQYPTNQADPNTGNPIQNGDDSLLCRMNALRRIQSLIDQGGNNSVSNNDRAPFCAKASPSGGDYCANPYKKNAEGNFDTERELYRTSSPEVGDQRACDTYCRTMERNCDGVYVSYGQCMAYCKMPYENIDSPSYVDNPPLSTSFEHYEDWESTWKNTDQHSQTLSCFINNAYLAGTEDPGSEGRNYFCESASFFDDPADPEYDQQDQGNRNYAGCGYFVDFKITPTFREAVYSVFRHRKCRNCHGVAERDGLVFRENGISFTHNQGIVDRVQEGVFDQGCTGCHNNYNPDPDNGASQPAIFPDGEDGDPLWAAPPASMHFEWNNTNQDRPRFCQQILDQTDHIFETENGRSPTPEERKQRLLNHLIGDLDIGEFDPFIDWALDEILGRIEVRPGVEEGNYNDLDPRPDYARSYEARVRAWVEESNMSCE